MKRRKFLANFCLAGGALSMPTIISGCKRENLTYLTGKNKLEDTIIALQNSNKLEMKLKQASKTFESLHGAQPCQIIRIISHADRRPKHRDLVLKQFRCNRTLDFKIHGSFLQESASRVPLKFPKVEIFGSNYYINVYDKPIDISLPMDGEKKISKPFHYITEDMLDGSIIIQKI